MGKITSRTRRDGSGTRGYAIRLAPRNRTLAYQQLPRYKTRKKKTNEHALHSSAAYKWCV